MTTRVPTTLAVYPELRPFVESEWRGHCDDGFESLLRTPSAGITDAWHALRTDRLDAQMALWESRIARLLAAMPAVRWHEAAPNAT